MEPTLFTKGKLLATKYSQSQEELNTHQPLEFIMNWFDTRINKIGNSVGDRILVLESSTGSGKSTTIPPELYHRFGKLKSIACTQPKVITAMEIPRTILPYHTKEHFAKKNISRQPLKMGENIGYQTGPFSLKPPRGIIFMTVGTLVQQMNTMNDEQLMNKYLAIIFDEAHETNVEMTVALYLAKAFIYRNYRNPQCPFLVTMSATYDIEKYARYFFNDDPEGYKNIIRVQGYSAKIDEFFSNRDYENYYIAAIDKVAELHKLHPEDFLESDPKYNAKSAVFRDMLIFAPGMGEIRKITAGIEKLNETDPFFKKYPVFVAGLTGEMVSNSDPVIDLIINADIKQVKTKVNHKSVQATRRIIVATPVVETGLTINTLKYVIETGYMKSKEYCPDFDITLFILKPITQSMYKQRRGRVGRKHPGECHVLYQKEVFDQMMIDQYPAIVKSEVSMDILNLLVKYYDPNNLSMDIRNFIKEKIEMKPFNIYEFDLLDIPPANNLHTALEKLYILGMINDNCIPTITGFIANKFRFIPVESIKMILAGYTYDVCISDLATIAAFLTERTILVDPTAKYEAQRKTGRFAMTFIPGFDQANDRFNIASTDLLINDEFIDKLALFDTIEENTNDNLYQFCKDNFIDYQNILSILEIRDSIIYVLATLGLNPWAGSYSYHDIKSETADFDAKLATIKLMKACIYEGYKRNICEYDSESKVYHTLAGLEVKMPDKLQNTINMKIYGDRRPRYFLYAESEFGKAQLEAKNELRVYHISVLDGYIEIDPRFDI